MEHHRRSQNLQKSRAAESEILEQVGACHHPHHEERPIPQLGHVLSSLLDHGKQQAAAFSNDEEARQDPDDCHYGGLFAAEIN